MALKDWEAIIHEILDESTREPKGSRKYSLFTRWRAKLEKEPPHLQPYQIDEIVREVRRRMDAARRQS